MPGKPPSTGHQPKPASKRKRATPPNTGSAVRPPKGMVTVTHKVGEVSKTFTGTVADLKRLGVAP